MYSYKVIVAENIQELREKVETFLSDGWQLAGGVSVYSSELTYGGKLFYQAMTMKSN